MGVERAQRRARPAAHAHRAVERGRLALVAQHRVARRVEQLLPACGAFGMARRVVAPDRVARDADAEFLAHAARDLERAVERGEPLHDIFLLCGRELARSAAGRTCGFHAMFLSGSVTGSSGAVNAARQPRGRCPSPRPAKRGEGASRAPAREAGEGLVPRARTPRRAGTWIKSSQEWKTSPPMSGEIRALEFV